MRRPRLGAEAIDHRPFAGLPTVTERRGEGVHDGGELLTALVRPPLQTPCSVEDREVGRRT